MGTCSIQTFILGWTGFCRVQRWYVSRRVNPGDRVASRVASNTGSSAGCQAQLMLACTANRQHLSLYKCVLIFKKVPTIFQTNGSKYCRNAVLCSAFLFMGAHACLAQGSLLHSTPEGAARLLKTSSVEDGSRSCKIVYAGFVGAMEPAGHKNSGVVQIRDTLRGPGYSDVCAESFIPIAWNSGLNWILKHFPSHPGPLTPEELASAPSIILVGHSTGGWAALAVARDLRDKNIPVELTVQIDSVGFNDYTVPRNVKFGAIFYARDALMLMTTKSLRMEDPAHTKIVANVSVKGANHLSITRDPRIRMLVLKTVESLRASLLETADAHREVSVETKY